MKFSQTVVILTLICYESIVAPPVTEKKKEAEPSGDDQQVFDVEYKRYLQEVVQVLESDDDFRQRLEKADPEEIKNGKIAKDLEFVNHNVRSKLDEIKRQELERLRHLAQQQYEHDNGIDKKHMKIPLHLDPKNPHTFEAEDLRKLIVQTTKELDDADKKRKEEFKEYEMQKELQYQEQLKQLDEKNRAEAQKFHDQQQQKHKQHPNLHHPGSKQQLEQVWEEQDHLAPEDFNPKTFFHLHDLDGNGVWDADEVKTLFRKELDKMYDPNAPEDDIRERYEESERMREHVFNETDTNKDQLISFAEFLEQTRKQEFQRDEGWDPIDQAPVYTPDEYKNYQQHHEEEVRRMIQQGLIPPAPPGYVPMVIPPEAQHQFQQQQQGYHPQAGLQAPPPGVHPNAIPQGYPQQGQYHPNAVPQQGQYHPNAVPQQGQYHPNAVPQQQQQQYQQYNPNAHQQQQQYNQQAVPQQQYNPNAVPQQQQQQQQYNQNPVPQQQQHNPNLAAQQPVQTQQQVGSNQMPNQQQQGQPANNQQPNSQGSAQNNNAANLNNQPQHTQDQQHQAPPASSTH